jgi:hypothetical protein
MKAEMDAVDERGALDRVFGRLRHSDVVEDVGAVVPHDVVITHDGNLMYAYAANEATLKTARSAIEGALSRVGIKASVSVSHWDDELDDWRQIDPPITAQEKQVQDAADRDAEMIETRTLVASSGKLIRAEFEQNMCDWANKLGVECNIIEHPHLLRTQIGFTVTGPTRKIDEFSQGLVAEERAIIRTETGVMLGG